MAEIGAGRGFMPAEDALFADVEERRKKGNAILFSRDSECLQDLIRLMERQKHRTLVMWALNCARIPLARFEEQYPRESRPRVALEICEAWARGRIKMAEAKRAILDAHAVSKDIDDRICAALCHAIGHAGATVHVKTHAPGLALYELTALVLEHEEDYRGKVRGKINFYCRCLADWQENIDKIDLEWAGFLMDDD